MSQSYLITHPSTTTHVALMSTRQAGQNYNYFPSNKIDADDDVYELSLRNQYTMRSNSL